MYFPAFYQSGSLGRRGVRGGTMNITKLGAGRGFPPSSLQEQQEQDSLQTSVMSSLSTLSELCFSEFGKNRNHWLH